mmetsp:Transcript_9101/g.33581  ORF Transcript_9101/g.33581 Transcript_9101/m.33581 type:complete len:208 (+) Transcript_9101:595-1218(+)
MLLCLLESIRDGRIIEILTKIRVYIDQCSHTIENVSVKPELFALAILHCTQELLIILLKLAQPVAISKLHVQGTILVWLCTHFLQLGHLLLELSNQRLAIGLQSVNLSECVIIVVEVPFEVGGRQVMISFFHIQDAIFDVVEIFRSSRDSLLHFVVFVIEVALNVIVGHLQICLIDVLLESVVPSRNVTNDCAARFLNLLRIWKSAC